MLINEAVKITCNSCKEEIQHHFPHCNIDKGYFCWDCSFVAGLISEKEYFNGGIGLMYGMFRAYVVNDRVHIKKGKYTPDELKKRRKEKAIKRNNRNKKGG